MTVTWYAWYAQLDEWRGKFAAGGSRCLCIDLSDVSAMWWAGQVVVSRIWKFYEILPLNDSTCQKRGADWSKQSLAHCGTWDHIGQMHLFFATHPPEKSPQNRFWKPHPQRLWHTWSYSRGTCSLRFSTRCLTEERPGRGRAGCTTLWNVYLGGSSTAA